jgi:predicted PhzF superfamily epimerase YddE/YHI9
VGQPIVTVDAFTDRPFAGNPAAVCVLDDAADPGWMQAVAREMNLSETAFVLPGIDGWDLRWFSPTVEIDLCGHATLASARVLWDEGLADEDEAIAFHTRSGILTAEQRDDGWIELDFPTAPADDPSVEVRELADEEELRSLAPDMRELESLEARVVYYTAPGSEGFDYADRVFGPKLGIPEDPATGSAHCTLAPLWAERLGKTELTARQLSARGATFRVRVVGDRVKIAGQAVTVMRGELAS